MAIAILVLAAYIIEAICVWVMCDYLWPPIEVVYSYWLRLGLLVRQTLTAARFVAKEANAS
jgi:hypothetical protein